LIQVVELEPQIKMNRISIIEELAERTKDRKTLVTALCHCGKIFKTQKRYVLKGKIKSCGCSRKISNKSNVLGHFSECNRDATRFYRLYKRNALLKNRSFDLTQLQFEKLTKEKCYYCGELPCSYHGIDRVNNEMGYEYGNIVSCCSVCNFMKSKLTKEKFVSQVEKIYTNINLCSSR
jgi:hypothetical protein